jgi:hypothetical protein
LYRALTSALKTRGWAEDEALDIAERLRIGHRVEGVEIPWVTTEGEQLVIDQFDNFGVKAVKAAATDRNRNNAPTNHPTKVRPMSNGGRCRTEQSPLTH